MRNGFLSDILSGRRNLVEILVVAIFLALGISLVADSLLLLAGFDPLITFILGIGVCLISTLYLVARVFGRRTRSRNFQGFFIYHEKKNEVIPVPRYDFSEQLSQYFNAAFTENKALKVIWDKEPLTDIYAVKENEKEPIRKGLRTCQLICEATEYFVLSRLSTHLTDYFNDPKFSEKNLREFRRSDIPDVLLKNRFLELFSKPLEDRPHFVKETFEKKGPGELVAMYVKSGAMYERFDLVLPKESIVRRLGENKVEIETKRFVMGITVRFEGSGTVMPTGFVEHYLSLDRFKDISEFRIDVDVQVSFKFGALLSGIGWEYYKWVDSFLDKLDESISESTFFESIGWDSAMTVIKCLTKGREEKKCQKKRKLIYHI